MLDKTNPRDNNPKPMQLGHGCYEDVITTLEQAIANDFLVGDQFTAADLYLASNLEWFIFSKVLENKPVFSNYIKLCQDRPGYNRYIEQVVPLG